MPNIKRHENLADFVSNNMGTMNALFAVAMLNGTGITEDFTGGELFSLPDTNSVIVGSAIAVSPYAPPVALKVLKKHQNNTDFVCQYFGSVESLFELAALNDISITETPMPGAQLLTSNAENKVVDFFAGARIDITSASRAVDAPAPIQSGIGYWQITDPANPQSNDFIVS